MKKILGILILVVAAMFQAQASDQTPQQRHTREQLAKIQAEHIAHDLALDDKTAALFIDTYCQSQREVWAVVGNRVKSEGSSEEKKIRAYLATIGLDYDALTKEEFVSLIGILKKSKYMKNPISQRGKARAQLPHGKGKRKRK